MKKTMRPESELLRRRMDLLALERAKRIEVIQRARREASTHDKLIEQAYQLLTGLFWSRADCDQRSHLLKVADWLMQLHGRNHGRFDGSGNVAQPRASRRNP